MGHEHHSHSHWKNYDYERSDNLKRQYIPVDRVLKAIDPERRDVVVDVACGSGFFVPYIAEKVSEVIAVDSNSRALSYLKGRMGEDSTGNVTVINEDVCRYVPESGNKVFISTAFHDLECREEFIETYMSKLNSPPFIIIEIKPEAPMGPPGNIKISPGRLKEIFSKHGYCLNYSDELSMHYIHRYVASS